MEYVDILKVLRLSQTEIDALVDPEGVYFNTTTGNIEYNAAEVGGGGGGGYGGGRRGGGGRR